MLSMKGCFNFGKELYPNQLPGWTRRTTLATRGGAQLRSQVFSFLIAIARGVGGNCARTQIAKYKAISLVTKDSRQKPSRDQPLFRQRVCPTRGVSWRSSGDETRCGVNLCVYRRKAWLLELHFEIAARFARRNLSVPF